MTKVALIGSQSTHAWSFVRLFNVEGVVPGLRISALCPECPEQDRELCSLGAITRTVNDPAELTDCQAALVLHRDAAFHADAARPFLHARVPVFVDKPLTPTVGEGSRLLALAATHGAPITSFSVMTMQQSWTRHVLPAIKSLGPLRHLQIDAPGDSNSPWGGILFYGIHAAELLHAAAPGMCHSVQAYVEGNEGGARLEYEGGTGSFRATVRLFSEHAHGYHVEAAGSAGALATTLDMDQDPYLTAALELGMFLKRQKPGRPAADILGALALIEAARSSLENGCRVPVHSPGMQAG
ncbi:MAG: hypothetical protein PWP23_1521 [Candidatus Sumerlaeota bacterium]|nr:hypothetical protein [Candidatus Sumerlaeota bacterium]